MLHYRVNHNHVYSFEPDEMTELLLVTKGRSLHSWLFQPRFRFECGTWTLFWVFTDNLYEELLACGHAVCPHTELLTSDLLLGQPVTRLHFVQSLVND